MPTMGSVSASAMIDTFGGRSHMANGINGLLCGVMSFATILFYYLPRPALAMIVISAVLGLIDIREVKFLHRGHRRDLYIYLTLVHTHSHLTPC
jgi:SulP family sulfate permease